jgi:prophage antirepressor-like protein
MEIVRAFNTNGLHTDIVIKGTIENPLFRASDVGEILEMGNIRSTLQFYDDTEKVVHTMDTNGGSQSVTFLTEKGLYKVLFKSRKPIAEQFQNWVCDVVKEIRLRSKYELEEINKKMEQEQINLQNKLTEVEEENKLLQVRDTIPIIYIYNTTPLAEIPILKIGYTTRNINDRIKTYLTPNGKGKLEFTIEVPDNNVNNFEKFIHGVFSRFLVKSEVFQLSVNEAIMIVKRIVNTLSIMNISDDEERKIKISKLHNYELEVVENKPVDIKITRDISCQTETLENSFVPFEDIKEDVEKNEQIRSFNNYIKNHCIVRDDVEISTTDIIGQYRILEQSASKEVYHALKDYLDKRFKPYRLKIQNKNQVVNGYLGVTLKELSYYKLDKISDPQNFIFHSCAFSPSGKVLLAHLISEYRKWKEHVKLPLLDTDEKELKTYLAELKYVFKTTIWANNNNGTGYYGLFLKKEIDRQRITSSTGKKVEKRTKDGNLLLATWETIAKAAEDEKICAAKMSRSIKDGRIFNDDYYYCTADK